MTRGGTAGPDDPPPWGAWRYLAAVTLSAYGDWLTTVAVVVVLHDLGGDAAAAGYMAARVLPRLLGATPGGVLADRFSPSTVVGVAALGQGALTAAVIPAQRAHALWAVYAAVAAAQLLGAASRSAAGAIPPRVARPERVGRVNALAATGMGTAMFVAPAVGAPLLAAFGAQALIAVDVATFAVAAVVMLTLRTGRARGGALRTRAREGLRAVLGDPVLRTLAAALFASGLAVTATSAVLVDAAGSRLGGTHAVGFLYAAVGAGGLSGALLCARRGPRRLGRSTVVVASLTEVAFLALFTATTVLGVALVVLGLSSFSAALFQVWGMTELQRRAPEHVLGRASAALVLAGTAGMVAGAAAAVALVPLAGWQAAVLAACAAGAVALVAAAALPVTRWRGAAVSPSDVSRAAG